MLISSQSLWETLRESSYREGRIILAYIFRGIILWLLSLVALAMFLHSFWWQNHVAGKDCSPYGTEERQEKVMGKIYFIQCAFFFITFTPTPLGLTHFPFLTTQLCVLYFPTTNQVQFVLSLYSWMCGLPWSVIDLPGAMLLKRIDSPSLRSYYK